MQQNADERRADLAGHGMGGEVCGGDNRDHSTGKIQTSLRIRLLLSKGGATRPLHGCLRTSK